MLHEYPGLNDLVFRNCDFTDKISTGAATIVNNSLTLRITHNFLKVKIDYFSNSAIIL
jgi:hypothetical protein